MIASFFGPNDPIVPPPVGGGEAPLTCEQCCKIKPASAFATFLQAKPGAPVVCDACLDTLPMDLVMALNRLNATPVLDPQNDVCWSCGNQLAAPTDGPALCGTCQEAGEQYPQIKPTLDAALATTASHEPAIASVAPAHCPNLAACDSSSCPTCDPLLTAVAMGESYFSKLHDDPIAFLLQFDGRDGADQESIIVAIAAWGKESTAYVRAFIDRSRARATALGMLGTCF